MANASFSRESFPNWRCVQLLTQPESEGAQNVRTPSAQDTAIAGCMTPDDELQDARVPPVDAVPISESHPGGATLTEPDDPLDLGTAGFEQADVLPSHGAAADLRLRVCDQPELQSPVSLDFVTHGKGSRRLYFIRAFGGSFVPLPFCFQSSDGYNKYKYRLKCGFSDIPGLIFSGRHARDLLTALRCPTKISGCTRIDFPIPFICLHSFLKYRVLLTQRNVSNVLLERQRMDQEEGDGRLVRSPVPWLEDLPVTRRPASTTTKPPRQRSESRPRSEVDKLKDEAAGVLQAPRRHRQPQRVPSDDDSDSSSNSSSSSTDSDAQDDNHQQGRRHRPRPVPRKCYRFGPMRSSGCVTVEEDEEQEQGNYGGDDSVQVLPQFSDRPPIDALHLQRDAFDVGIGDVDDVPDWWPYRLRTWHIGTAAAATPDPAPSVLTATEATDTPAPAAPAGSKRSADDSTDDGLLSAAGRAGDAVARRRRFKRMCDERLEKLAAYRSFLQLVRSGSS